MPDLTGLPALDVAIGLSFIFLLLSLVASVGQEILAGLFALRAKTLEKGLRNLLDKTSAAPPGSPVAAKLAETKRQAEADTGAQRPENIRNLTEELYAHPLIRSLYKESWWPFGRSDITTEPHAGDPDPKPGSARRPSYISPRAFAVALFDTLAPAVVGTNADGTPRENKDVIRETREAIEELNIPGGVKHRLLTILDTARGDVDKFRLGLEAWFDDAMARVSGWYKRKAQLLIFLMAVVVTIALNANTITIGERLWRDPALRGTVLQQAGAATGTAAGATALDRLDTSVTRVEDVSKLGVPIGWSQSASDPRHISLHAWGWARLLGGWLLTILAVSLGAPFWFDALSRLARLRGTGKPETPLPASGSGKPNERVVTVPSPVSPVSVNVHPPAQGDGSGVAAGPR
jgi:hypothetical protein